MHGHESGFSGIPAALPGERNGHFTMRFGNIKESSWMFHEPQGALRMEPCVVWVIRVTACVELDKDAAGFTSQDIAGTATESSQNRNNL